MKTYDSLIEMFSGKSSVPSQPTLMLLDMPLKQHMLTPHLHNQLLLLQVCQHLLSYDPVPPSGQSPSTYVLAPQSGEESGDTKPSEDGIVHNEDNESVDTVVAEDIADTFVTHQTIDNSVSDRSWSRAPVLCLITHNDSIMTIYHFLFVISIELCHPDDSTKENLPFGNFPLLSLASRHNSSDHVPTPSLWTSPYPAEPSLAKLLLILPRVRLRAGSSKMPHHGEGPPLKEGSQVVG